MEITNNIMYFLQDGLTQELQTHAKISATKVLVTFRSISFMEKNKKSICAII